MPIRPWVRCLAGLLLVPLTLAALYASASLAFMLWPANAGRTTAPPAVEAWVFSNGVHTDLVLPIRNAAVDWASVFPPGDARAAPADAQFIAIGWGDREFFLHTPTWADLTARRAFGALLGGNRALLHVQWLHRPLPGKALRPLPLSQADYAALVGHVRDALPQGRATPIPAAGYAQNDAFYEALGGYNAFETCNTWTGRGLRRAGVPVSRWTPFDFNVVAHLPAPQPAALRQPDLQSPPS